MPSSFSSWSSDERSTPNRWNGSHQHDERDDEQAPPSATVTTDASNEELREELAGVRRRLQYYEGFAPWIEEQMASVVERAAEVAAESEREQARLAEAFDRRSAEIARLEAERDRLQEEAKRIVAEANSTADGVIAEANATAEIVIGDANATASRIVAEAQQNAESLVGRLREEAAVIVGRALGDLSALEARNTEALQGIAQTHVDAPHAAPGSGEPDAADTTGEWQTAAEEQSPEAERAPKPASDPDVPPDPATQVEPHNGLSSAPLSGDTDVSAAEDGHEAALDDQGSSALPETTRSEGASSDASAPDAGPFQWLRSALAGGNASARKDGPASGDDQPASNESDGAVGQDESDEECFVTRLVVHPAFTPDERRQLQERVSGFSGVQRATVGAVQNDSFEMHVTHELYTSMLGSLLASAGENIRLIAQRDDSLEIEITALDWALGGAGAT